MKYLSLLLLSAAITIGTSAVNADMPDPKEAAQAAIAPQPSGDALEEWAVRNGKQLMFDADLTAGMQTQGAAAGLSEMESLSRLLEGTGLVYRVLNERTISIFPKERLGKSKESKQVSASNQTDGQSAAGGLEVATHVAQADGIEQEPRTSSKDEAQLEEIVVTAQKRAERLQDVPVPVSSINPESLANNNQLQLQSYYTKVPGLNLALSGDTDTPLISIRGITTGGLTNPTVGVVIDDVSYGGTVIIAAPQSPPEIDPSDLARIEVLRGPQGTLYGASSMGGLLKYVTVDPSTAGFAGRVQAGLSSVASGEVGHTLRGAINVPLSQTFAVRASAFTTREPGYVDNALTGQDDVNRRDSDGGRLSALWQPSQSLSLKISALLQDSRRRGPNDVDITLGADPQETAVRGTGTYQRKTQAYSATLAGKFGKVDLVSATGYSVDRMTQDADVSVILGGPTILLEGRRIEKFTQEVRASMPLTTRVTWLIGGFYTNEDGKGDPRGSFFSTDPNVGAPLGTSLYTNDSPNAFDEYAAFTNLTVDVTDRMDIQFGGRYSENRQSLSAVRTGIFSTILYGADPSIVPTLHLNDSSLTHLVTPRLKISSDLTAYARIASGYRPGGINIGCGAVQCAFDPDTTQNYELGMKGSLLNRALNFDASVYYIDWKNIQTTLMQGVFLPTVNASRAESQGIELSIESKPFSGLSVSGWVAYNDAKLTEDFPPTSSGAGFSGDRLPYSARLSGNLSLQQEFPLGRLTSGFVGTSVSYVGDRKGTFLPSLAVARANFPAYTQVDVNAGLRYDTWALQAFVNNATNRRGVLRGGADAPFGQVDLFSFIQPRTVGLTLTRGF